MLVALPALQGIKVLSVDSAQTSTHIEEHEEEEGPDDSDHYDCEHGDGHRVSPHTLILSLLSPHLDRACTKQEADHGAYADQNIGESALPL